YRGREHMGERKAGQTLVISNPVSKRSQVAAVEGIAGSVEAFGVAEGEDVVAVEVLVELHQDAVPGGAIVDGGDRVIRRNPVGAWKKCRDLQGDRTEPRRRNAAVGEVSAQGILENSRRRKVGASFQVGGDAA